MELLKQRIRDEGIVLNNRVLKVDGFLNHQIDPHLFKAIGKEIADRYRDAGGTTDCHHRSIGYRISIDGRIGTRCTVGICAQEKIDSHGG